MRPVLVLLCLSAGFAAAQAEPPQKAAVSESYPVWWSPRLDLAELKDAPAQFLEPISKGDLSPEGFYWPTAPEVHNCAELLAAVALNDFSSLHRVGPWGEIGSRCAEYRELGHAVPARSSAIRSTSWTSAVFSLLPAGIYAADSDETHRAAVEAGRKGLSLRQYWERATDAQGRQKGNDRKGIKIHHYFAFGEEGFDLGAEPGAESDAGIVLIDSDRYEVVARGDFVGDGWEDILVEARFSPYHSLWDSVAVYLLTRKSADGRFEIVKQVF